MDRSGESIVFIFLKKIQKYLLLCNIFSKVIKKAFVLFIIIYPA